MEEEHVATYSFICLAAELVRALSMSIVFGNLLYPGALLNVQVFLSDPEMSFDKLRSTHSTG